MIESDFQKDLIEEIESLFPGALVTKQDATYIRGIPDLSIFYGKKWAFLECKKSAKEKARPGQEEYIAWAKANSFGSFIYPENKEEVLDELQQAFRPRRKTRIPRSE